MKLTWTNIDDLWSSLGDDDYENLCLNSKASDFYFTVSDGMDPSEEIEDISDDDGCYINICPKEYFDNNDCCWDQSMMIEHLLPENCFEACECCWETFLSKDKIKKELVDRGFIYNEKINDIE